MKFLSVWQLALLLIANTLASPEGIINQYPLANEEFELIYEIQEQKRDYLNVSCRQMNMCSVSVS